MTYSVLAVIYIALDREHAIPFVVGLMFLYLVYSFFEVKEVSKINRLTRK
ncbi:MAG: hypothetical protein ACK5HT_06660 [Draconibacterium sp.]